MSSESLLVSGSVDEAGGCDVSQVKRSGEFFVSQVVMSNVGRVRLVCPGSEVRYEELGSG